MEVEFRSGDEFVLRLRMPKLEHIVPPEAADHMRQAGKETLLSLRAVLDRAIERCDAQEPTSTRKTRIPVE